MSKQTTIILGAGASVEYGYPTGETLITNIINKNNKGDYFVSSFLDREGIRKANAFCKNMQKYDPLSIDRYLSMHSNDEELVNIGKTLIACEILSNADPKRFTRDNRSNWYKYLFEYVFEGNDFETKLNNDEFRIITFNYDLSLEYFFHSRLEQIPSLNKEQAWDIFCKFSDKIHHVYGQVYDYINVIKTGFGGFKCASGSSDDRFMMINQALEYGAVFTQQRETGIKIIGEERSLTDTPEMVFLRTYLTASNRVFVLGFGFDSVNCGLIGLTRSGVATHSKIIYATNHSKTAIIKNKIKNLGVRPESTVISEAGTYESLRDDFLLTTS